MQQEKDAGLVTRAWHFITKFWTSPGQGWKAGRMSLFATILEGIIVYCVDLIK